MLEWQEVDIDMVGALDTKSDPKNVVQTNLDIADNIVYTENGSVTPRQSATTLNTSQRNLIFYGTGASPITYVGASPDLNPNLNNLNTLYKNNDQILSSDGSRLMSFDRTNNIHQIVGMHAPNTAKYEPVISRDVTPLFNGANVYAATTNGLHVAQQGNYRMYAYSQGWAGLGGTNSSLNVRVEEISSGTVVIQNSVIGSVADVRTEHLVVTTAGMAYFAVTNAGDVVGTFWNSAAPTVLNNFTQVGFMATRTITAADYNPTASRFCMLVNNSGTGNFEASFYTIAAAGLTLSYAYTIVAGAVIVNANLATNTAGAEVYDVAWITAASSTTGGLFSSRVVGGTGVTLGPITHAVLTISLLQGAYSPFIRQELTTGRICIGCSARSTDSVAPRVCWFWLNDTTHVKDATIPDYIDGLRLTTTLTTRPVSYNRQVYIPCRLLVNTDYFTLQDEYIDILVLASSRSAAPEIAWCDKPAGISPPKTNPLIVTGNTILIPKTTSIPTGPDLPTPAPFDLDTEVSRMVFELVRLVFAEAGVVGSYAEYNGGTVIAGGYPKFYDGSTVTEFGFLAPPSIEPMSVVASFRPNNILIGNTYSWCAVYAWTDSNGRKHRSQPSDVSTLTAGSSGCGLVNVLRPAITSKMLPLVTSMGQNVMVEIYRTQANQSGPFYLAKTVSSQSGTTCRLSITDTATDTEIASAEQLYTTGGVLPNESFPPVSSLCVYADRLFIIDSSRNRVGYLKSGTTQEYSGYSSLLFIPVGNTTEPVTALGVVDQTLSAFTATKIFQTVGQPANDQGAGSTLDTFLPIASEAGCPYPKSLLPFQGGLIFYSLKGFYVLDRSGATQYIGAPVEAYAAGNVCTGASLVFGEGTWQARFMMAATDRSTSFMLCYDTQLNRWSRHTYTGSFLTGGDVLWVNGSLWISGVNPGIASYFFREDPPRTNSASENFVCTVRTGWISPFGRTHQGKIRRIAALLDYPANGNDRVTVTLQTNYGNPGSTANTTTSTAYDLQTGTGLYTLGVPSVSRLRLRAVSQRAESFRVQVSWTKAAPYAGAWTSLTSLSAEVAGMTGAGKLPLTQTMTNT